MMLHVFNDKTELAQFCIMHCLYMFCKVSSFTWLGIEEGRDLVSPRWSLRLFSALVKYT